MLLMEIKYSFLGEICGSDKGVINKCKKTDEHTTTIVIN